MFLQSQAGPGQCTWIKIFKKNIILKDQYGLSPRCKPFFQTLDVGFKDSLFPVAGVPGYQDKFDPW